LNNKIITNDFYEAAYMLINNCELVDIEGTHSNNRILCNLILSGENITKLRITYLNGEAEANILNLRRMVGQVSAWVHGAKKKIRNQALVQIKAPAEGVLNE
jgi:hypothetical protein